MNVMFREKVLFLKMKAKKNENIQNVFKKK